MSTEGIKSTNRRFYETVIDGQDLEAVEQFVDQSYTGHSFPPGLPPGTQGLKMFLSMFFNAFPDSKVNIESMIAEDDMTATRLTYTGTHQVEFQGIPPTGKSISIPAIDLTRFENGKLVDHWGGPDQLSLLVQLGVVPPPGG